MPFIVFYYIAQFLSLFKEECGVQSCGPTVLLRFLLQQSHGRCFSRLRYGSGLLSPGFHVLARSVTIAVYTVYHVCRVLVCGRVLSPHLSSSVLDGGGNRARDSRSRRVPCSLCVHGVSPTTPREPRPGFNFGSRDKSHYTAKPSTHSY